MTVDALQLEKLDAREGDLFVLTLPGPVTTEVYDQLRQQWAEHDYLPRRCVVLSDGMKLERVRMMRAMVAGDLGL